MDVASGAASARTAATRSMPFSAESPAAPAIDRHACSHPPTPPGWDPNSPHIDYGETLRPRAQKRPIWAPFPRPKPAGALSPGRSDRSARAGAETSLAGGCPTTVAALGDCGRVISRCLRSPRRARFSSAACGRRRALSSRSRIRCRLVGPTASLATGRRSPTRRPSHGCHRGACRPCGGPSHLPAHCPLRTRPSRPGTRADAHRRLTMQGCRARLVRNAGRRGR